MSDETLRQLERRVLSGDVDAMPELKREWARVEGSTRKCWICHAYVPLIAYEDHEKACRTTAGPLGQWASEALLRQQQMTAAAHARSVPLPGGVQLEAAPAGASGIAPRVVPIPGPGVVGARAAREPIWLRGSLRPGEFALRFVRQASDNTSLTNLTGVHASLPVGGHFFWYGLSLVPDAGNDPGETLEVWNVGELAFLKYGSTALFTIPCRLIMTRPEHLPTAGELSGLEAVDCRFPTIVGGRPLELLALEAFEFELRVPSQMRNRPFNCMLILFGIRLRSISS